MFHSSLHSLPLLGRGKVRDLYAVGEDRLLIVTTDRLSAYDVILPTPIPEKGRVLTQLSSFWFGRFEKQVRNHLTGVDPTTVVRAEERDQVQGRAIVVRRLRPLPLEAVVRGYLAGSGWKEYEASGKVCGVPLPPGLRQASKLPEPIFTPATKAEAGAHDENITFAQLAELVGEPRAREVKEVALRLYREAADYAQTRGILIADTKFEFGVDEAGTLHLIDEALTPDSSRFWPALTYREGTHPESFDKQYVRDWLDSIGFARKPPAPELPADVTRKTSEKYQEALRRLTGEAQP